MTPSEYQALAGRTECTQANSLSRMEGNASASYDQTMFHNSQPWLTPIRVNHSIIGMAGEVGEMASLLQKWIYYGKFGTEEQKAELKKQFILEYGDLLWYAAEGMNALGIDMDEVMEANIQKLRVRFPDKYTDFHAADENRDRKAEEDHVTNPVTNQEVHITPTDRSPVTTLRPRDQHPKPIASAVPPPTKGDKIKCQYCDNLTGDRITWIKGRNNIPVSITLPYCGKCDLKEALAKRGMTAPVMEGIDYQITKAPS